MMSAANNLIFEPAVFDHMRNSTWTFFLSLLFATSSMAQFNIGFEFVNSVPILKDSDTLQLAWAGGLNNPQISALDFHSKSGDEIVVFDRDGALIKGFSYNAETHQFEWHPQLEDSLLFERHFPALSDRGFCLFKDYNQDGFFDIITTRDYQNMAVFRNEGGAIPSFALETEAIITKNGGPTHPIRMVGNQIPVVQDLDEDGDLDIMFFATNLSNQPFGCNTYAVFDNLSMDEFGSPDSLKFKVTDRCWGKITPSDGTHPISNWRAFDCDTTCQNDGARHKDVTLTQQLHDLDGDGALDLLITYDHNDELYAMYNGTNNSDPAIDLSLNDFNFPSSDEPVKLSNQPYPYFIDVDGDGDRDMWVASNQVNGYNSIEYDTSNAVLVDLFYENQGSNAAPDFRYQPGVGLSAQMLDIGLYSMPVFADMNGDGLPDLIIGNVGHKEFNPELSGARLHYYENIGEEGEPAFTLIDDDFAGAAQLQLRSIHPAIADMDGDGDLDLLVGDETGHIHFFKNQGHSSVYQFGAIVPNFESIDVGGTAHPQCYDLNNDQRMDLVIGDAYGRVQFYENTGTTTVPDFTSSPTIENLGEINVFGSNDGHSTPWFTRGIDSTGGLYMLMGTGTGEIYTYGPITNLSGAFEAVDSIVVEATHTSITMTDLIGDGKEELIIGQKAGGLYLMSRNKETNIGIGTTPAHSSKWMAFPNPTNGQLRLRPADGTIGTVKVAVYSINGMLINVLDAAQPENGWIEVDLSQVRSGTYLLSITDKNEVQWLRVLRH